MRRGLAILISLAAALSGCAHRQSVRAANAAGEDMSRPLIVWETTGMGVGTLTQFVLYDDGRAFLLDAEQPRSRRYRVTQLSASELQTFLAEIPFGALRNLEPQRVYRGVHDLPLDTIWVWPSSGTARQTTHYGGSLYHWMTEHPSQPDSLGLGAYVDPVAVGRLKPFWRLLDQLEPLRNRAEQVWREPELPGEKAWRAELNRR